MAATARFFSSVLAAPASADTASATAGAAQQQVALSKKGAAPVTYAAGTRAAANPDANCVYDWSSEEVERCRVDMHAVDTEGYKPQAYSKYNPTPGTGRTGFTRVAPNNYPFYSEHEKYAPVVQADGGQLSEWQAMYNPSKEQAEEDRAKAYAAGVPHGYVAPDAKLKAGDGCGGDGDGAHKPLELWVVSELHDDDEYGEHVTYEEVEGNSGDRQRRAVHRGGPFKVAVSSGMRVEDLRLVIRDKGGIIPALQRLSYAGRALDDSQRTLEHYGVAYWWARFPHWPIIVRRG